MPLTGSNGREPEFIIPDVFTDQAFHQIVIAYNGHFLNFYIDTPANQFAFELVPSMAIFTKSFPDEVEQIQISHGTTFIFRLLFGGLIFLPLSFLALIWSRSQPAKDKNKFVLVGIGLIVFSTLWEFLLGVVISSYHLSASNIVLNVVITAVSFLFLYNGSQFK
jgi:hypothetical protein